MNETYFLDSNIFMYAAGKDHVYKNPCLIILNEVESLRLSAVINSEVLQELLYRYSHIGLADKGIVLCKEIMKYPITIFPITEIDIRDAIELFNEINPSKISPRDAIHAANMKNNGINKIISADKDFDKFDFVKRIDPLEFRT